MVPVLTSFLPPTHTHLYLPALFKIWEAFNSGIIDDRLLEMCGELSEDHVSGTAGDAGQGGALWKDVGIWTESQWAILVGKGLGSISKFIFFFRISACIEFVRCSRWSNEGNISGPLLAETFSDNICS
jgi:hypothetical protein